ncbi:MAG: MarR family transcriptional regulator [Burkholderiaceae bacterium]|nr:MAG: MarR family transcriptional regulator [Burkholderiaceae bacterium]TAM04511.1 MAG: MarR family transcriptional regulator [Pusillimonas sp.]
MNSSTLRPEGGVVRQNAEAPDTASSQARPLSYTDLQNDSLGYAIKRAQVRTYEALFRILGPSALSPARMTALSIVATRPGVNQSELAEMLSITRAGVVKIVDALGSLGYVRRQSIPDDRRSYALRVTNSGLAELRRLNGLMQRHERQIAARITKAERRQLMGLLEKIATE